MEASVATSECSLNYRGILWKTTSVVRGHRDIAIARKHGLPVGTGETRLCGENGQKLNSGDQTKLWRALDQNPFATNRKPCFTAKVAQDQEPEELSGEWKTAAGGWLDRVKRISLCKRIYQDETAIYANEAPKKGRARKGKPIFRARNR